MNNPNISQIPVRVEIDIVRHHNNYFYNRRENGFTAVSGDRISSQRAQEIVAANAHHVTIQTGMVRFDAGYHEFSWTARIVEASDGD